MNNCFKNSSPLPFLTVVLFFSFFDLPSVEAQVNLLIESRKIEKMIEDARTPKERALIARRKQKTLEQGKSNYQRFCAHCHGKVGKGDGEARSYLRPNPRDLSQGIFKFHSTQPKALPLDEDLFKSIKRGVPGTAMPAWGPVISDQTIKSIVIYLKSFSKRFNHETPDHKVLIGLETPFDKLSIKKGEKLYIELRCKRCHGEEGVREGPLEDWLRDFWGNLSFVYDLRRPSLYKGGTTAEEIHQTLVSGLDGTPMNSYNYLTNVERWHLIHYLQSGFRKDEVEQTLLTGKVISQKTLKKIDTKFNNRVWNSIPTTQVQLRPIRVRKKTINTLKVQSIYNNQKVAFRLIWNDPLPNSVLTGVTDFLDAAAIQFPVEEVSDNFDNPFFGMGEHNKPVNIWHWKADSNHKIENELLGVQKDKTSFSFLNPFNEKSVEEINSRGFGSLSVQSLQNQQVSGNGKWKNGQWTVIFVRDLYTPDQNDVRFNPKQSTSLAFAIWNGSNKDKNANKVISFWQHLFFN